MFELRRRDALRSIDGRQSVCGAVAHRGAGHPHQRVLGPGDEHSNRLARAVESPRDLAGSSKRPTAAVRRDGQAVSSSGGSGADGDRAADDHAAARAAELLRRARRVRRGDARGAARRRDGAARQRDAGDWCSSFGASLPATSASPRWCADRSSWYARRASPCASSASAPPASARGRGYNNGMIFGPASPDLLPGARNAVETCLAIQPGERVALDCRSRQRRGGGQPRTRADRAPRRRDVPVDRVAGSAAAGGGAAGSAGRARAGRCRDPLRPAAGRRARRPPRHRRRRRAAADPLRAHGRRDAADHARRDARGLSPRRSPQPAAVRADAVGDGG